MSRKGRWRLDRLLVDRGLVKGRERAKALIMAGKVVVDGVVVDKAGAEVKGDAIIAIKEDHPYVGRGGVKLEGALDYFHITIEGLTIMDVGASTGGFTDCLLKRGARKVFAIDVGKGLLDWHLRQDKRVGVLEGRNIRYLGFDEVGEKVDMAVVDVSFISLEKVLPNVKGFIKDGGSILALIKPQFEVGKGEVGKGGIVRDPERHRNVIERIKAISSGLGLKTGGVYESPIRGAKGNKEFWIWLKLT
ncbi:MAG: TlyA family RNA methyltransferase [Deltaproteobacteria bacterium]|nr:TlyA family RNA methyltransferase [Deltaproteobacteria bacterium]